MIEFRSKESIVLLCGLSVLLSLVAAFGMGNAFLNPQATRRVFPVLWWLIFLFSATVSLGRSYEHELENAALDGLRVSGVSIIAIYFSKVLGTFLLSFFVQALTLVLLGGFLEVPLWSSCASLLLVSAMASFGYACLGSLLAALTSSSKLRGLLLPLVFFPLLFPLLLSGLQLSSDLLQGVALQWDSPWLSFLGVLDFIYVILGWNLFPYVIAD